MLSFGKNPNKLKEEIFDAGCKVLETHRELNDFSEFHQCSNEEYEQALHEMKSGRKTSHWIWYIFPQLALHGRSDRAVFFGLKSFPETLNYLKDPILGSRLVEISTVALEQLRSGNKLRHLMGSSIDASKMMSCSTLFFFASKGMECNIIFKELMLKCKEEQSEDIETEQFCLEAMKILEESAMAEPVPEASGEDAL